MADDTAAALQALIQQVTALTETVESQQSTIDGIKKHNERLLDKVKDDKRANPPPGMERGPDGNFYMKGTRPTHSLTREEARDPQKYRAAKAAAEKAGATLAIVDNTPAEDNHRRARPTPDQTLKTRLVKDEDQKVAYLHRDDMRNSRQYRNLRRAGFTVQSFDSADDLPQHMQTKLALMEKSHESD